MSKRIKVLLSMLLAVVLLTVIPATVVMAQEEPAPETQVEMKDQLLARVADILGLTPDELAGAFEQARDELREEGAAAREQHCQDRIEESLERALAEDIITEEEADEIREWLANRPEALEKLGRNFGMKRHFRICGPQCEEITERIWGQGEQIMRRIREHLEARMEWRERKFDLTPDREACPDMSFWPRVRTQGCAVGR